MLGCARYGTHGAIQRLQFIASQAIGSYEVNGVKKRGKLKGIKSDLLQFNLV